MMPRSLPKSLFRRTNPCGDQMLLVFWLTVKNVNQRRHAIILSNYDHFCPTCVTMSERSLFCRSLMGCFSHQIGCKTFLNPSR